MAYSNSSLVNCTILSPNHSGLRNHAIDTITIHHMAFVGSAEACGNVFASASRKASSNYGIGNDGRIGLYVEEKNRAWTTSSSSNDNRAVTIEVSNSTTTSDDWPVSKRAMESLINLVTDICKRNGIKKLRYTGDKSGNMTLHKWFAATGCPGPYLTRNMPYIQNEVNKRLGQSYSDNITLQPGMGGGSEESEGSSGGLSGFFNVGSGKSTDVKAITEARRKAAKKAEDSVNVLSTAKELKSQLKSLNKDIFAKGYYSTWIHFTIGKFVLNVSSDKKKNVIVSLENQKSGTEKANTFTIQCVFALDPRGGTKDIDGFEKQIAYNMVVKEQKCTLQYGYMTSTDKKYSSPKYEGSLTDFEVEFRDGLMYYTLQGYSSVAPLKETTINAETLELTRPTIAVKNEFDKLLKSDKKAYKGWTVAIDESAKKPPDKMITIPGGQFDNIFVYAKEILSLATPDMDTESTSAKETKEDKDKKKEEKTVKANKQEKEKSFGWSSSKTTKDNKKESVNVHTESEENKDESSSYTYYIDDAKKQIVIKRITNKEKAKENDAVFTFNWGSGKDFVIDFRPKFKGLLTFASEHLKNISKNRGENKTKIKNEDLPIDNPQSEANTFSSDSAYLIDKENWKEATDKSYEASMTTLGIPFEIPITTVFEVNPLIYGHKHNSAGKYMVTSIRDQISANGYTTSFEMMRLTAAGVVEKEKTDTQKAVEDAKNNSKATAETRNKTEGSQAEQIKKAHGVIS